MLLLSWHTRTISDISHPRDGVGGAGSAGAGTFGVESYAFPELPNGKSGLREAAKTYITTIHISI